MSILSNKQLVFETPNIPVSLIQNDGSFRIYGGVTIHSIVTTNKYVTHFNRPDFSHERKWNIVKNRPVEILPVYAEKVKNDNEFTLFLKRTAPFNFNFEIIGSDEYNLNVVLLNTETNAMKNVMSVVDGNQKVTSGIFGNDEIVHEEEQVSSFRMRSVNGNLFLYDKDNSLLARYDRSYMNSDMLLFSFTGNTHTGFRITSEEI